MWESIILIGAKLLAWWLDKTGVDIETKKRFFEFVNALGKDKGSVKLMNYGEAQKKWLDEHPWEETK